MDVFNTARGPGAAVFFITGRDESQRAATDRNLARGRLHRIHPADHGTRWCTLCFGCGLQGPQRAAIEGQGYTIIANLGDQPSDLDGGFAERTYQLPNPFYRIP